MADGERRALVAVAVSVVGAAVGIAGAGHAYLREWGRAFAWFSFVLGVGLILFEVFAGEAATVAELPLTVTAPLIVLLALSTLDAYHVARREPTGDSEVSCPSCGRDMDPELEFCPWCAGARDGGGEETGN